MGGRPPFLRSTAAPGADRKKDRGAVETEKEKNREITQAVLFGSVKPLERAENLKAVYDEYDGPKKFVQLDPWRRHPEIRSGKYSLLVIDEFPRESPGKVLLLGHGITGGKSSYFDSPYPYITRDDAKLLTRVVTTSEGMVDISARLCGVTASIVEPLGMPRTDAYKGKRKGDGGTILAEKRSYLYAPTYRSREETPMPVIDWAWLDEQLQDDEVLAVKPHTMTGSILPSGSWRHIVELPAYEPSAPYLIDCDVVITDYSSILFDGYLLGKPAVLLEKQKGYTETRGMYLDYPGQYCSRYCTDEKTLLSMLREADSLNETERECIRLVAGACDGHATERVCDLIRSLL